MRDLVKEPLVQVEDLKMHFPIYSGVLRRHTGDVKAVDGVSFSIQPGETLGLVGELFGERSTFVGGMVFASLGLLLLARTRQKSSPTIAV